MSFICSTIHKKLQATTAVTNIVSGRGYPSALPQDATIPAYTYQLVSDVPEHHMGGAAALSQARIQIDCYSETESGANTLAEAVRLALQGQRWNTNDPVRTCHVDNSNSFYDPAIDGSDKPRYVRQIDFMVNYKQNIS